MILIKPALSVGSSGGGLRTGIFFYLENGRAYTLFSKKITDTANYLNVSFHEKVSIGGNFDIRLDGNVIPTRDTSVLLAKEIPPGYSCMKRNSGIDSVYIDSFRSDNAKKTCSYTGILTPPKTKMAKHRTPAFLDNGARVGKKPNFGTGFSVGSQE